MHSTALPQAADRKASPNELDPTTALLGEK
jgi:hypothetical protein